jgi:hypothetical protein
MLDPGFEMPLDGCGKKRQKEECRRWEEEHRLPTCATEDRVVFDYEDEDEDDDDLAVLVAAMPRCVSVVKRFKGFSLPATPRSAPRR